MSCTSSTDGDPHTSTTNLIILQIERKFIKCNKSDLISNSDYFKAMFEGNFVESSKNVIPLNGVEADAMAMILKLLWDREYIIEEEHVLSVLQAACMLQFLEVKATCIERLLDILSVKNCLKIWICTEHLDLTTVYFKAKLMALLQFVVIQDCDYFLELSLREVVNYLGNINLQVFDETTVFQAIIKWYRHMGDENSEILLRLLHCLDFTTISEAQIEEYLMNEVEAHLEVVNVLQCILAIRKGSVLSNFEENCIEKARSLLKSKSRNLQGFPCILVENLGAQQKLEVVYYDKFNRKRKHNVLENSSRAGLSVMYIGEMPNLKKLFDVDSQKCANLEGFKMMGYKQFVYLFGGEYGYGTGDWNLTFYVIDTIKEKLEQKDPLPFPRRHFETCICGNRLYIIGGIGPFRVRQKNIFWYNLTEEKWSNEVKLPCSGRQIKCCSFNSSLFILDINKQCGHSFNPDTGVWTKMAIRLSPGVSDDILPNYSPELSFFSYKSSLYIKECKLCEMKVEGNSLVVVKQSEFSDFQKTSQAESVICNNVLYSLKERWTESGHPVFLESFNVDSLESSCAFQNATDDEILEVGSDVFIKFRPSLIIFNVFHHSLIGGNDLINDSP